MAQLKEKEKPNYPKELIVKRKKNNPCPLNIGDETTVVIYSGVNRFTDPEQIKGLMDHQAWNDFIENGTHEVMSAVPVEAGSSSDKVFTAMNIKKALEVIDGTCSIAALEQMRAEEDNKKGRSSIINAINDRIKVLENPEKTDLVD